MCIALTNQLITEKSVATILDQSKYYLLYSEYKLLHSKFILLILILVMKNMKQSPMKYEANTYYGLISVPQICATNANANKVLSTVYPTMSTLFYIVKIIANRTGTCMPSQIMTCMHMHKPSQT